MNTHQLLLLLLNSVDIDKVAIHYFKYHNVEVHTIKEKNIMSLLYKS